MIAIWTLAAVVLHFVGLGAFATWPVSAFPNTWSCMCLLYWEAIIFLAITFLMIVVSLIRFWRH